jgi:hypothetical protein
MEMLMGRRQSAKLGLRDFMSRQPVPVPVFFLVVRSALEHDADAQWLIDGDILE